MVNKLSHNEGALLSRRNLLCAVPAAGVSVLAPASAVASNQAAIMEVLYELENGPAWEASCVAAAKAYAAHRMRKVLGLEIADTSKPQLHLNYQNDAYQAYRRSALFERDQSEVMS